MTDIVHGNSVHRIKAMQTELARSPSTSFQFDDLEITAIALNQPSPIPLKCTFTGAFKISRFILDPTVPTFSATHTFSYHPGLLDRNAAPTAWRPLADPAAQTYRIVIGEPTARPSFVAWKQWYAFVQVALDGDWYYVQATPNF